MPADKGASCVLAIARLAPGDEDAVRKEIENGPCGLDRFDRIGSGRPFADIRSGAEPPAMSRLAGELSVEAVRAVPTSSRPGVQSFPSKV